MQSVTDDISILHFGRSGFDSLAIQLYCSLFDRLGVVFGRSVSKLIAEDIE